jgi:hypothetical protein
MAGTLDEVTFAHTTILIIHKMLGLISQNIFAHEAIFSSLELYLER